MLKGIFPPIPTPFENDEVSYDKLKFNIDKWNQTPISGYVVMGSNGESAYLTMDEKIELITKAKEYAAEEKLIIAGTGLESIKDTIKLSNAAADGGAEYALVLTPFFYKGKMDHQAFVDYFTIVADNIKIPVIIYNVPKFTGVDIQASTVEELSNHHNIIGIKNSSENVVQTAEFVFHTPNDFITMVGTASVLYPGLCVGAEGGILALANIAPAQCVDIYNLFEEGELEESLKLQYKMIAPNKAVTAKYGVAGLKKALELLGYFGGRPRKPLAELGEKDTSNLINILKAAEVLE